LHRFHPVEHVGRQLSRLLQHQVLIRPNTDGRDQYNKDRRNNGAIAKFLFFIKVAVGSSHPERSITKLMVSGAPEIPFSNLVVGDVAGCFRDVEPEFELVTELQGGGHRQHCFVNADTIEEGAVTTVQVLDMPLPAGRGDSGVKSADTGVGNRNITA